MALARAAHRLAVRTAKVSKSSRYRYTQAFLCCHVASWLSLHHDVCVLEPLLGETALQHLALQVSSTDAFLCTRQLLYRCKLLWTGQGRQGGDATGLRSLPAPPANLKWGLLMQEVCAAAAGQFVWSGTAAELARLRLGLTLPRIVHSYFCGWKQCARPQGCSAHHVCALWPCPGQHKTDEEYALCAQPCHEGSI